MSATEPSSLTTTILGMEGASLDEEEKTTTPMEKTEDEEFVAEDVPEQSSSPIVASSLAPVVPPLDLNSSDMFRKDKLRTPSKRAVPFSVQSPSQELYAKYIRLEQDFKDLQKAFDLVSNEKSVLEKVVKQKEQSIEKTQLDLENLQDVFEKIKERSRAQEIEIKTLQSEKKVLEEHNAIASLQRQKTTDTKSRTVVQEDALDRILGLENEIKLKNVKISSLETEIRTLNVAIEKKDKAIETIEKQMATLQGKHDKVYEIECRNAELLLKLEKAQKEIKTLQEITRMKTRSLEELNNHVETLKNTSEEFEEYKKKIAAVTKENERLKQEIRVAERSFVKKDKEISKLVIEKDVVPVKTLEGDKRFLHSEVKKLQEQKAILEKTIQVQDKKIESLRQRYESIELALKETKVDKLLKDCKRNPEIIKEKLEQIKEESDEQKNEFVPASVVDLIMKDVDDLRKLATERENIISDKDAVIESLERKIEVLDRSKVADQKLLKKKISTLQDEIAALKENLVANELNFKEKENNLKREKFALKKSLNQTGRPNTASAVQQ
ncbi:hypothetical protein C9374_001254 [Naegleria lovaniensis]|uniref:Uncharacterized protein n=1 Tax=Naegleria lovaniensis TaxID=51637 RepID=A0AA88GVH2_NAELO|nr:uncharacterized protein C9374_001254 [Naegleria lovaniensis]KAG2387660.1 hypothetical protein C9374_001254 [Naegleria lovaniensis]